MNDDETRVGDAERELAVERLSRWRSSPTELARR
jgi:hypothetical protein